ncbi:MAG: AAA family ATPase, partial [Thermoguttaceae bacterium]|nr:AAA family ATPase [Thermoguttaceae bacterium]
MKITSLKIERFGVWEGLNLPKVSRGLNVFYGPNEAGKTTLMQFMRACLYGGADEERSRYIQMALDGKGRRVSPEEERRRAAELTAETASVEQEPKVPERAWVGGVATVSSEFGDHRLERRYIKRDSSYMTAIEKRSGFVTSDGLVD